MIAIKINWYQKNIKANKLFVFMNKQNNKPKVFALQQQIAEIKQNIANSKQILLKLVEKITTVVKNK